jgi:uncharacterized alpha-E superfamily protein
MIETTHNPFDESYWASCLRENLTSSSYGEGLETDRASAEAPRQSFTRQTWHKVLSATRAAREVYLVAQSHDDDCRPTCLEKWWSRPDVQPSVAYGLWRIP